MCQKECFNNQNWPELIAVTWDVHRKRWPAKQLGHGKFVYSGGRQAFVARHTASHQLRFMDPVDWQFQISPSPVSHLSLEDDMVIVAQVRKELGFL